MPCVEDDLPALYGRFKRSVNEISLHFASNASSIKIFFRTRYVTFTYVNLGLLRVIRND